MDELNVILQEIRPGKNFADAENFFEQGLLDSLDLTILISALESRFGIFVDVDEIVPDNFRNLPAIRGFLTGKGISATAKAGTDTEQRSQ
jgi:acyl carrier protein